MNFPFSILQELQKHGSPDMVMALVGNKADLLEKREVSVQVKEIIHASAHCISYLREAMELIYLT